MQNHPQFKKLKALVIWSLCLLTVQVSQAQTFDFTGTTGDGTNVITQEKDGLTVTATIPGGNTWQIFTDGGFYPNIDAQALFANQAVSTVTVSFSSATDVTSIAVVDGNTVTRTFTLTPTGGSNSAVEVSSSTTTAAIASLNWTGVTSFTIEEKNGASLQFIIDNLIVSPSAAADPEVTLTVSDNNPSEGDGAVTITATADVAPSADLTINLGYSGTATGSGTDYTEVGSIVISSGSTSNTGTLNITSDSDVESDETIIIDIASFSGVTATEGSPNQQTITIINDDYAFSIKAFLEGPLSGTTMSTALNGALPTNPNTIYSNALSETSAGIPGTAVDWVEVELRTGTAAATKVGTNRGAILKSDGTLVDKDGNAFTMTQADGTSYYIVIHHRNHLSVMSNAVVPHSSGTYTFDFTVAQANNYNGGANGAIQVGSVFAMYAGDANGNGTVDGTDLTTWRAQNGVAFTYSTNGKTDLNMDGVINAVDRNGYQQKNNTTSTQVPSS